MATLRPKPDGLGQRKLAAKVHVFEVRLIVHGTVLTPPRGLVRIVHMINPSPKGFRDIKVLDLSFNRGCITLTAEALCALPQGCKVVLQGTNVSVVRPSADGEMGAVVLPTGWNDEFAGLFGPDAKTVAEICAFAGVQHMALVKPARPSEPIEEMLERVTAENRNVYPMKPQFAASRDVKREAVFEDLLWTAHGCLTEGRREEGLGLLKYLAGRGFPEARVLYEQFTEGKMRAAKQSSGTAAAGKVLDYNCSVCDESSTMFVCAECKGPRYCGVVCQKADWAKHKFVCEKKGGL